MAVDVAKIKSRILDSNLSELVQLTPFLRPSCLITVTQFLTRELTRIGSDNAIFAPSMPNYCHAIPNFRNLSERFR